VHLAAGRHRVQYGERMPVFLLNFILLSLWIIWIRIWIRSSGDLPDQQIATVAFRSLFHLFSRFTRANGESEHCHCSFSCLVYKNKLICHEGGLVYRIFTKNFAAMQKRVCTPRKHDRDLKQMLFTGKEVSLFSDESSIPFYSTSNGYNEWGT